MKSSRRRPKRRRSTVGMRVTRERNRSRSAVGENHQTARALSGIELPVGAPPSYPREPGPWDVWGSWRDGPPYTVGGAAFGAGGVIGPAYGEAVRLEPRAVTGSKLGECTSVRPGSSCSAGTIGGEWPWALCWVPGTGRSPTSSGIVGVVWLRGKRPLPARHQRLGEEC